MDIFDFDNVKAEKAKAMLRYCRFRNIAKLFRVVEGCLGLVFFSWISRRLPFAVKISVEYFRQLYGVVASPIFIFVVVNIILLTLLVNSGQFSSDDDNVEKQLCEELVENSESSAKNPSKGEKEEIVYEDKQMICEVNANCTRSFEVENVAISVVLDEGNDKEQKVYRRSQSEKMTRESVEKHCGVLRRSETEKCRKMGSSSEESAGEVCAVDGLSDEEFQRTVEAFIAKQTKFHREEYFSIVPHNNQTLKKREG